MRSAAFVALTFPPDLMSDSLESLGVSVGSLAGASLSAAQPWRAKSERTIEEAATSLEAFMGVPWDKGRGPKCAHSGTHDLTCNAISILFAELAARAVNGRKLLALFVFQKRRRRARDACASVASASSASSSWLARSLASVCYLPDGPDSNALPEAHARLALALARRARLRRMLRAARDDADHDRHRREERHAVLRLDARSQRRERRDDRPRDFLPRDRGGCARARGERHGERRRALVEARERTPRDRERPRTREADEAEPRWCNPDRKCDWKGDGRGERHSYAPRPPALRRVRASDEEERREHGDPAVEGDAAQERHHTDGLCDEEREAKAMRKHDDLDRRPARETRKPRAVKAGARSRASSSAVTSKLRNP